MRMCVLLISDENYVSTHTMKQRANTTELKLEKKQRILEMTQHELVGIINLFAHTKKEKKCL